MTTISSTFSTLANDSFYLPSGLASSTEIVDKFCKLAMSVFNCNESVTQSFKRTTSLLSTAGFVTTLSPMLDRNGDAVDPWEKRIRKIALLGGQLVDAAKGLNTLDLISFEKISNNIGRLPVLSSVWSSFPLLTTVGSSLILVSTVFSTILDVNAYKMLANQPIKQIQTSERTFKDHSSKVRANRISLISNIAKAAIISLGLAFAAAAMYYGVDAKAITSTVMFSTRFGAVTLGNFSNTIGMISAVAGFAKSMHTYAEDQKKQNNE